MLYGNFSKYKKDFTLPEPDVLSKIPLTYYLSFVIGRNCRNDRDFCLRDYLLPM